MKYFIIICYEHIDEYIVVKDCHYTTVEAEHKAQLETYSKLYSHDPSAIKVWTEVT